MNDTSKNKAEVVFQFPIRLKEEELARALAQQQANEQQAAIAVAEKAAASADMAQSALHEIVKQSPASVTSPRIKSVEPARISDAEYAKNLSSHESHWTTSEEAVKELSNLGEAIQQERQQSTLTRSQFDRAA